MSKVLYVISVTVMVLFNACHSSKKNPYDFNELNQAWKTNNKEVFRLWMESLGDSTLSDGEFFSRVADLSGVTNFAYGNIDVTDSVWFEKDWRSKNLTRKNIAAVYRVYRNSCLFLNKDLSLDESLVIQERFFKPDRALTTEELKAIESEVERLCTQQDSSEKP